jgi:hypothetical protein
MIYSGSVSCYKFRIRIRIWIHNTAVPNILKALTQPPEKGRCITQYLQIVWGTKTEFCANSSPITRITNALPSTFVYGWNRIPFINYIWYWTYFSQVFAQTTQKGAQRKQNVSELMKILLEVICNPMLNSLSWTL